ncbi:MAG: toll/interleukin-1 receptor domain-containing protein [Acidobacteria bacterium]|nr:toll/interleukin-1 receptor domain-containing protein [Acidobacteriota bacterium]
MAAQSHRRSKVFISYSHQDAAWLRRLRVHLRPLEREHRVEIWDDTRIKPGSRWKEEIGQALAATKVAVLLISADFLASDFIARDELPQLLSAAEKDGATILPVILSPSRFEKTPSLSQFQAVNDPSEPLIGLTRVKQEAVLVKVSEIIEASLNHWLATAAEHGREDEAVRTVEPGRQKSLLIRQSPGHLA